MFNSYIVQHRTPTPLVSSELEGVVLKGRLFVLACSILLIGFSATVNAVPSDSSSVRPVTIQTAATNPFSQQTTKDCTNMLALRLSLMGNSARPPLHNCNTDTFIESPPLSAFDCVGLTANECAALYQSNLPHHYMSGGWSTDNELWYLPVSDDVAGGNLCIDGTRQFVYADKAVNWQCSNSSTQCSSDSDCAPGSCNMNDIESNDWVFYTQGGVNCESGQDCLAKYLSGEAAMSTSGVAFSFDGAGILSDHPHNPYHGHNRVRLRKCTKDGFMGNTTRPIDANEARPSGEWNHIRYEFDLYFHGFRQWLAAFDQLRSGVNSHLEYSGSCSTSSECGPGGECVTTLGDNQVNMCRYTKSLPALSDADSVIIVGWSGGSNALTQTGDRLVELLQTGAQALAPNSVVSLAFDAPWKPGLESDTAFSLNQRNMYLVNELDIPTEVAPGLLPDDADAAVENGADAYFSNRTFLPGGSTYTVNEYWHVPIDASCIAMHGLDSWYCHERNHVLANHVTAPAFTRMAQRDKSGTDLPGSNHMHSFELCRQVETQMNCYDWVDEEFRQRSFQQSVDFYRDFSSLGEEGPGAPNRGVFATDNTKHNGLEDEQQFLQEELVQCREDGVAIKSHTLASSLYAWQQTGNRIGAIERREGTSAGLGYVWVSPNACTACPQVDSAQVFSGDDDLSEWDMSTCTY